MESSLNLIVVKTKKDGIFVSDNIKGDNYFTSKIPSMFFDDKLLVATFKKDWYKLEDLPNKIETKPPSQSVNFRYELKQGFPETEMTPKTISSVDWDEDSQMGGLYELKFDKIEKDLVEVDFNLEILSEEENFSVEKAKYPYTTTLITSLTTHPALHSERPCTISGAELYKILRKEIQIKLDRNYAKISSDYDFCLGVEKIIPQEKQSYQVDVGKRRPKYETRYTTSRSVKVLELCPTPRDGYEVVKPILGENQKDLESKVEKYISNIIEELNKPLINCECCKGMGVIDKKE